LATVGADPSLYFPTERTHDSRPTSRNAQCPCGSGLKYKRCCGPDAAPILQPAA
jgi:hypothetical protein